MITTTIQCSKKEMNSLKRKFKNEGRVFTVVRSGDTYWITA